MSLYETPSKRETADPALRRLVGEVLSREDAFALEGSGWEGDLDALRDEPPVERT